MQIAENIKGTNTNQQEKKHSERKIEDETNCTEPFLQEKSLIGSHIIEEENKVLKAENTELKIVITKLEQRVNDLEVENNNTKEKYNKVFVKKKKLDTTIDALLNDRSALDKRNQELGDRVREMEASNLARDRDMQEIRAMLQRPQPPAQHPQPAVLGVQPAVPLQQNPPAQNPASVPQAARNNPAPRPAEAGGCRLF